MSAWIVFGYKKQVYFFYNVLNENQVGFFFFEFLKKILLQRYCKDGAETRNAILKDNFNMPLWKILYVSRMLQNAIFCHFYPVHTNASNWPYLLNVKKRLEKLQEQTILTYLIIALSLKFIALLHNNVMLILQETFFIDWEKPKIALVIRNTNKSLF